MRGKNLSTKINYMYRQEWACRKCRNKKTTLVQENCGKERLEDYICCIVRQQMQSTCSLGVFLCHSFSVAGQSPCVFIPALFLYFLLVHPCLQLLFTENFYAYYVYGKFRVYSMSILVRMVKQHKAKPSVTSPFSLEYDCQYMYLSQNSSPDHAIT